MGKSKFYIFNYRDFLFLKSYNINQCVWCRDIEEALSFDKVEDVSAMLMLFKYLVTKDLAILCCKNFSKE